MAYQTRSRDPLLDSTMQAAIEKRGKELIGLALIGAGLAAAAMIGSYTPDDPNWMVSTDAPVSNWLGRIGASIAAPLFMIVGWGSWGLSAVLIAWGLRFALHRGEDRVMSRMIFAPIAIAVAAVYCATLVPSADWRATHSFGLGGLFGDTVVGALLTLVPIGSAFAVKLTSLLMMVAMLGVGGFVLGFTRADAARGGRYAMIGLVLVYGALATLMGRGASSAFAAAKQHHSHRQEQRRAARVIRSQAAHHAAEEPRLHMPRVEPGFAPRVDRSEPHFAHPSPLTHDPRAAAPQARVPAQASRAQVVRARQPDYAPEPDPIPDDSVYDPFDPIPAPPPMAWQKDDQPAIQPTHQPAAAPRPQPAPQMAPQMAPESRPEPRGLRALMPALMRRPEPLPEPELVEPQPLAGPDQMPGDDRIRARISEAVRARKEAGLPPPPDPTRPLTGGRGRDRRPGPLLVTPLSGRARAEPKLGGAATALRIEPPLTAAEAASWADEAEAAAQAAYYHSQYDSQPWDVDPAHSSGQAVDPASYRAAPVPAEHLPETLPEADWQSEDGPVDSWNIFAEDDEADPGAPMWDEIEPELPEETYPAAQVIPLRRREPLVVPQSDYASRPPAPAASNVAPNAVPGRAPVAPVAPAAAAAPSPASTAAQIPGFLSRRNDAGAGAHRHEPPVQAAPAAPQVSAAAQPASAPTAASGRIEPQAPAHRAPASGHAGAPAADTQPGNAAARVQHPDRKPLQPSERAKAEAQPSLAFEEPVRVEYDLPPLSLLADPRNVQRHHLSDEALEENARMLESVLDDYGVKGEIVSVRPGPVVTMYELEPAPGLKASRVIGLADDIARSMSALSARVSTVPGRSVIGIELPNESREKVVLREILASRDFGDTNMSLPLALGKDIGGDAVVANLAKMPHLLIAGTTGSGKSVAINTMILSLLYKLTPHECRLIMIDPKMLELSVYDGIPHLLSPVVTDPKKAVVALKWVVGEMEDRYRKMSKMGVRNIEGFNGRVREAQAKGEMFSRTVQTGFDDDTGEPVFETEKFAPVALPYIVVIVDEMADLMMVAGKEIEACIQRLAQMARASGIHLIMATQRPSVDVITGTIKANFPTRISFQVTSKIDSRTILGEMGAEQLLGMGDMLYMAGGAKITRCHGPFVSDEEVEEVVNNLKAYGPPDYVNTVLDGPDEDKEADIDLVLGLGGNTNSEDALYDQAVAIVIKDRKCSTSYIQRKLAIGYNKAARLVEQMEDEGIVSAANHVGKRDILVPEPQ